MKIQLLTLALSMFFVHNIAGAKTQHTISRLSPNAELRFYGSCDASGAVAISAGKFAVADDEDNVIRVYDANTGGAPIMQYDLSYDKDLKINTDRFGRPLPAPLEEMDIEAATGLNGEAYWVTSHGRDSKGRIAPDRLRFFATSINLEEQQVNLSSPAVTDLLEVLATDPGMESYKLMEASLKSPKAVGGLALEGMTARPNGGLLFGFRNPVPENKALMVELKNPKDLLGGKKAELGKPVRLDLGGRGVRGLSYWRGQYLIAAGAADEGFNPALYRWYGEGSVPTEIRINLPANFNIEAFFTPEEQQRFMVLSDDGGRRLGGEKPCKKLKNANEKFFRGLWVETI